MRGHGSALAAAELGRFSHVVLTLESRIEERHYGIALQLRKATEAGCMTGMQEAALK